MHIDTAPDPNRASVTFETYDERYNFSRLFTGHYLTLEAWRGASAVHLEIGQVDSFISTPSAVAGAAVAKLTGAFPIEKSEYPRTEHTKLKTLGKAARLASNWPRKTQVADGDPTVAVDQFIESMWP